MPSPAWGSNNQLADWAAQNQNLLPQLWKKGAEVNEKKTDFWQQFEGAAKDSSVICAETDTSKKAGTTINIRTREGLYGLGKQGDALIGDATEKLRWGGYQVKVDFLRHASYWTEHSEEHTGLVEELERGVPQQLGQWLGRRKTEMMDMKLRQESPRIYLGTGGADGVLGHHTLTVDAIINAAARMKNMAKPAKVGKAGHNDILKYMVFSPAESLANLKETPDYKNAIVRAGIRGDENYVFKGGFADLDGNMIIERVLDDHAGFGPIGSPQQPKAWLGDPITADNLAQNITGGGSAEAADEAPTAMYFRHFSSAAFTFIPGDAIAAVTDTERYCLIINPLDAEPADDPGKIGFYAFQVNDGQKLVMTKRLRAATSGIAYQTIGGVTWNTGDWEGKHTDHHPSGSVVLETNRYGVPLAHTFMLGSHAAVRGYGSHRNKRVFEKHDGDMVKKAYISSIFGQTLPVRPDGRKPNSLCIVHAYYPPGLGIPRVTTV